MESNSTRLRIVLADDHPLIRVAIGRLLEGASEFELVGEASDGLECLDRVAALHPDILLLDVSMPKMDGEQVTLELRKRFPRLKIIALSGHTGRQFVRAMFSAGADGYVVKSGSAQELLHAMRAVVGGENFVSPEVMDALLPEPQAPAALPEGVPPGALGEREREVLALVAGGQRSAQIAVALGIAVATVEVHRRNILRKLDLHGTADLTRYALRHGLLKP